MDEPLRAYSLNELTYYLLLTPCSACGKGPRELADIPPLQPGTVLCLPTRCRHCRTCDSLGAILDHAPSSQTNQTINPTDKPSRIVDPGQWLSLFYMLIESASAETSKPATRLKGLQAALCLAEALKFYGDDELPPASAFFTSQSMETFRQHPEKFARQRLRDMQAKLPALSVMAGNVALDRYHNQRRWWQLWKKRS